MKRLTAFVLTIAAMLVFTPPILASQPTNGGYWLPDIWLEFLQMLGF